MGVNNMNSLAAMTAIVGMLDSTTTYTGSKYYAPINPRMHHTKPHETTAAARARKKAERQRKKNGRRQNARK